MKNSLRKKLDEISKRHQEVEELLSDQNIVNDMDKYKNLSVEYAKLDLIVKDYKKYLKPEFENLIKDLTKIIENYDSGIETELKDNLGKTHTQWGPIPHRWAAIHSKGRDKTLDVQFFINLTSKGLRVGICVSHQRNYSNSWKSFLIRLLKRKEFQKKIKNKE